MENLRLKLNLTFTLKTIYIYNQLLFHFTFLTELLKSVRTSVKHEGLRSMYIGLVPTLIRDVPFSSKSDKSKLDA